MKMELAQLKQLRTYAWVPEIPKDKTLVGSRWVFKEKRDEKGNVIQDKGRVVAQGFSQVPGQDFNATYTSVARFTTLRALFAIAAHNDWELHQVDIRGAYLQGDLDEEIYMKPPDGANKPGKEGWIWKLLRPLYGLKQAGRQWKRKLEAIMQELGFTKSAADDCLFIKREGRVIVVIVVVVVYVDDMAMAGPKHASIDWFKISLGKWVEIKDLGELKYILGIEVTQDRKARTIWLNQTAYLIEVLQRYSMENCTAVHTPLVPKDRLTAAQSPSTPEEKQNVLEFSKGISYSEQVGVLLYAMQMRPDIRYAVSTLTQFSAKPGKAHYQGVKHVLRYLKGTTHFGLVLGNPSEEIDLIGWTDSDWVASSLT
jgi:hypothetical protein